MAEKVITAKLSDTGRECSITYDFGDDCQTAIEKFGDEAVFTGFVSKSVITAQAAIRRFMEAGLDDEEIQTKMASWKPGVALERTVDPVAALMSKFGTMSAQEQADLLAKLQARAQG